MGQKSTKFLGNDRLQTGSSRKLPLSIDLLFADWLEVRRNEDMNFYLPCSNINIKSNAVHGLIGFYDIKHFVVAVASYE